MECHDLSVQVNSLEAHQQSLVHRNEDLNNCLQHKTSETHEHQTLLSNHESEINTLNGQILSFNTQLKHLRSLEDKYVNDN
jgi:chromosome segregation ATPase